MRSTLAVCAGSLQTRLDLTPQDVAYLKALGHFDAAPKQLTWRQKLRVVLLSLNDNDAGSAPAASRL